MTAFENIHWAKGPGLFYGEILPSPPRLGGPETLRVPPRRPGGSVCKPGVARASFLLQTVLPRAPANLPGRPGAARPRAQQ